MRARALAGAIVAAAAAAGGCATIRSITALRQVEFAIDTVVSVNLAGVRLDRVRSFNDLGPLDAARLTAATLSERVPLSFVVHVRGTNPVDNRVTARMVRFTWTAFLNGREVVSGAVDSAYAFPPGIPTIVAVPVSLDLYQFFEHNGRAAIDLAIGLLGGAARPTEVHLTATPVIDTPLGAITYPHAITIVRQTVGQAPTNP